MIKLIRDKNQEDSNITRCWTNKDCSIMANLFYRDGDVQARILMGNDCKMIGFPFAYSGEFTENKAEQFKQAIINQIERNGWRSD